MLRYSIILTPEEVKESLISQGAENVLVLPLRESIDTISAFVIATGRSHRHIRKMSESVVIAVIYIIVDLFVCMVPLTVIKHDADERTRATPHIGQQGR